MKWFKEYTNVVMSILAYALIFWVLKFAGTTLSHVESVVIILLLLIYSEFIDIAKKKK